MLEDKIISISRSLIEIILDSLKMKENRLSRVYYVENLEVEYLGDDIKMIKKLKLSPATTI